MCVARTTVVQVAPPDEHAAEWDRHPNQLTLRAVEGLHPHLGPLHESWHGREVYLGGMGVEWDALTLAASSVRLMKESPSVGRAPSDIMDATPIWKRRTLKYLSSKSPPMSYEYSMQGIGV